MISQSLTLMIYSDPSPLFIGVGGNLTSRRIEISNPFRVRFLYYGRIDFPLLVVFLESLFGFGFGGLKYSGLLEVLFGLYETRRIGLLGRFRASLGHQSFGRRDSFGYLMTILGPAWSWLRTLWIASTFTFNTSWLSSHCNMQYVNSFF